MADISAQAPITTDDIRQDYMAMTRRKRLYSGTILAIFVALMVAGFDLADARNAGGFWDGWHNILDFPAQVLSEAIEKAPELPGHLLTFLPALIETVNIAAASTLMGRSGRLSCRFWQHAGWPAGRGSFRCFAGSWTSCARSPKS